MKTTLATILMFVLLTVALAWAGYYTYRTYTTCDSNGHCQTCTETCYHEESGYVNCTAQCR